MGNDDNEILASIPIKKIKGSKTAIIVLNKHVMEMLEEINIGNDVALDLVFNVEKNIVEPVLRTNIEKKRKNTLDRIDKKIKEEM